MVGVEVKLGRNVPKGLLGDVFGCGERERAARSPIHQGKVELGVVSTMRRERRWERAKLLATKHDSRNQCVPKDPSD